MEGIWMIFSVLSRLLAKYSFTNAREMMMISALYIVRLARHHTGRGHIRRAHAYAIHFSDHWPQISQQNASPSIMFILSAKVWYRANRQALELIAWNRHIYREWYVARPYMIWWSAHIALQSRAQEQKLLILGHLSQRSLSNMNIALHH